MDKLFRNRFRDAFQEVKRYLRYMFNDHLLFVLIILIGGFAYTYQDWVNTLPETFPGAFLTAFILGMALTLSRAVTLLKEPDVVFWLPMEKQLTPYFQKAFFLTWMLHTYGLLLLVAVLFPLYIATTGQLLFLPLLLIVIVLKGINLWIRWHEVKDQQYSVLRRDAIVRFVINTAILYWASVEAWGYSAVAFGLLLLLTFLSRFLVRTRPFPWEWLLKEEEARWSTFYSIANLFADVPKLRAKVKRRRALDILLQRQAFQKESSYFFLFLRTFVRKGDYFPLVVRLTVIGVVVIWVFQLQWSSLLAVWGAMYLTAIQLVPLYKQHVSTLWLRLYPLQPQWKEQAFYKLLRGVLMVQLVVLSAGVAMFVSPFHSLIALVGGLLLVFGVTQALYKRLQTSRE
ncbi:ABC transporter permease [Bacillus fonticola]|uniref:ABC transporter permease n=1 Tax=Bacillus fonticola TaxID=2728853 RepID=UPI001474E013|nr:ABC transporter permease [Bacillus fonticola]